MSTTKQQSGDPAAETPTPTPTPAPTPATPPTPKAGDQPKGDDEPLGTAGLKALQAEREAREAAERELAALRKQVGDSQKTAEQKAAEALDAARKTADEAAARALRYEVAAEKGLDLKLAARLTGSSKEELEADADQLKALIPTPEPAPTPTGQPVPVDQSPAPPSGNVSLKQQIAAAEASGDLALARSLKALQLGQTKTI